MVRLSNINNGSKIIEEQNYLTPYQLLLLHRLKGKNCILIYFNTYDLNTIFNKKF